MLILHLHSLSANSASRKTSRLNLPLLFLHRRLPPLHLPPQILRPLTDILRRQKRQAGTILLEQVARATVEHGFGCVDSRLGYARHAVTERARAAQEQPVELGARRERTRPRLRERHRGGQSPCA